MPSPRSQAFLADTVTQDTATRVIKKYPNRRLYDTRTSSYITLVDVKKMVLLGEHFAVQDAKTEVDLTRSVLLQIILEEEAGGLPMFSAVALAQMIRFHGHAMQSVMGTFFEKNLQLMADMQNRMVVDPLTAGSPVSIDSEIWAKMLSTQTSTIPDVVTPYLDQSRQIFTQLQNQMEKQAQAFLGGVLGRSGKG
jgi:polyhydroxyalkanoate synthesis repressor PhaR